MRQAELTSKRPDATPLFMQNRHSGTLGKRWLAPVMVASTAALGGCISVNAPEGPIVIELNINIRQEVIYRLAEDAGNTIEENADIF
ncbi:MAG: YnbE family lipoprotein [Allopontixanthobacter sediminis]